MPTEIAAPSQSRVSPDLPPEGTLLPRSAVLVVILTFVLILAGALVTSTNSGMAFGTWPDADGEYLWPNNPTLSGVLEHSHRLIGAALGLAAILLVVLVGLRDKRKYAFVAALVLLGMITIQGLLGGYRVLLNDQFPVLYPTLHGFFAQVVFATTGLVALLLSPVWAIRAIDDRGPIQTMRRMAVMSLVLVCLQAFLGVVVRHSNNTAALWAHVGLALIVALVLLITNSYCMGRFGGVPGFTRLSRIGMVVLGGQVLLGFVAFMLRRPKELSDARELNNAFLVSSHVVIGGLLLLITTLLVARSFRNLVPRKPT